MADLSTEFMGLKLANPLVPSASPLTKDLDTPRRLEDAGAAALVMYSLFEEKIEAEAKHFARFLFNQSLGHGEADSFRPVPDTLKSYQENYLEHLQKLKSRLRIPVIASLNGTSQGGWLDYGRALQEAGADALELNIYYLAADGNESSEHVEARYLEILTELKRHIRLPIALKLSPYFSSLTHFVKRLEAAGADGIVLFNRFYQPDIDLETLQVVPRLTLSSSQESLLRIRWMALLYGRVRLSMAVTGGFQQPSDILKAMLAGADVVQLCSVLLERGPSHVSELLTELQSWLIKQGYESFAQLKGSISQQHAIDPSAYERANYVQVLDNYSSPAGVLF